ncbi:tannase/feruloyl esterase family alpha/beta hydrolase [Sodalis sp. dw_96]|uniref:tannase/feruloyl esterase family alpha/beta hydrolase n=1 Tax=Sodalis sp. dw_96 TaxID=2719794 RepID=UPI001BD51CF9|nr:tannase/feruloyl esterase family alpha/beta hydrolase [Sodalis sp. dw_96]
MDLILPRYCSKIVFAAFLFTAGIALAAQGVETGKLSGMVLAAQGAETGKLPGMALTLRSAESGKPAALAVVKPAIACSALAQFDLSAIGGKGGRVVSAQEVSAEGTPFCAVEGLLAPEITFKLMLPMASWNQRYMQLGCGGLCGQVNLQVGAAAGCALLNSGGFALAATDMGHAMSEQDFGNDPQKRRDFAYRSVHLTSLASKALVAAFYHRPATWSYFNGCSDGGREALMEAQRYPKDFNGIIAGAPAMNFQVQNALYQSWQAVSNTGADGKAIITAAQLPFIHQAVLAQCDAIDGQKDGLIADPQACHFNMHALKCDAVKTNGGRPCLTDIQLTALRRLYDGPRDAGTGKKMTVGGPQYGSELAWAGVFVPQNADAPIFSRTIALSSLKYMNFVTNPPAAFALKDLKFTTATFQALEKLHPLYDATNPDLSAFASAGGKLIIWHGWADPHISPLNSIAYHNALAQFLGTSRRDGFERLYLLPGVYHCSGGEGPSLVDFLTPMMAWVEKGTPPDGVATWQAPDRAKNSFGQPDAGKNPDKAAPRQETIPVNAASRPVFPYPYYAVYGVKGDRVGAVSYIRRPLLETHDYYQWLGEGFYRPYKFMD